MAISLRKGQRISLSTASNKVNGIIAGLGWDSSGFDSVTAQKKSEIDCDLSAILCGLDNKACDVIYFEKRRNSNDSIVLTGDNRTGGDNGEDEKIYIHFTKLPPNIGKIVLVANIYDARAKRQHFGMIGNAYIKVINWKTGEEICRYNLTDNYSNMTGIIIAEIVRFDGGWDFVPSGKPLAEASRLQSVIKLYQ